MDWITGLVSISGIISVTSLLMHFFPQKSQDPQEIYELRAENDALKEIKDHYKDLFENQTK